MSFKVPPVMEAFRIRQGPAGSRTGENAGFFLIRPDVFNDPPHDLLRPFTRPTQIMATDGLGVRPPWEHVSVCCYGLALVPGQKPPQVIPRWDEMNAVKNLFWGPADAVMQLHPPLKDYVNQNEVVLHLWRPAGKRNSIPLPPKILV